MVKRVAMGLALVVAPVLAAAQAPSPSAGQGAPHVHQGSGVSFARSIGGQRILETVDLGSQYDSIVNYGGTGPAVESTTIYIFRAAYPDATLWFGRAAAAVEQNLPLDIFSAGTTETFTAFGAAAPNGLHRIYTAQRSDGPFRTTAIAVAQAGEWLVKVRLSSASLDAAGMRQRIAEFTRTIRFPEGMVYSPLSEEPVPCRLKKPDADANFLTRTPADLAAGITGGLLIMQQIRRPFGPVISKWCRAEDGGPPISTVLLPADGGEGWIVLVGDAGKAVTLVAADLVGIKGPAKTILYASTPSFMKGAAFFDKAPGPSYGFAAALPVLGGQTKGEFDVTLEPGGGADMPAALKDR